MDLEPFPCTVVSDLIRSQFPRYNFFLETALSGRHVSMAIPCRSSFDATAYLMFPTNSSVTYLTVSKSLLSFFNWSKMCSTSLRAVFLLYWKKWTNGKYKCWIIVVTSAVIQGFRFFRHTDAAMQVAGGQGWRQQSSDGGADASDEGAYYFDSRALKPDRS